MGFEIAIGARVRKSPYFNKTVENGVTAFSVYNHMYMPTSYGDPEGEYWRLINGVSMWDVSVERQVELEGPDAEKLARLLTPRDLGDLNVGQGRYVPICDHNGTVINDPVLLPVSKNKYWLSIADSDIVLWARAIGAERELDVTVREPDSSPLAVQGPKAAAVVASLCGDWVHDLKYFGFREVELDGIPLIVARSGWSKQGGFEFYLRDDTKGEKLWDIVKEAGQSYEIGPGCPNYIERIESGLVSYGADTDDDTNPFELGLGKFVNCDREADFIGKQALKKMSEEGAKRHFVGYFIEGDLEGNASQKWPVTHKDQKVGFLSASCHSPRLKANIGVGLIAKEFGPGAENLVCKTEFGDKPVQISNLPFKL